jgi:hypothetical protein
MKAVIKSIIAAMALSMPLSVAQAATLSVGDAFSFERQTNGITSQAANSTITNGTDLTIFGVIPIDLNAGASGDGFTISSLGNYCGFNCNGSTTSFIFSGLDFGTAFTIDNFVNNSGYSVTTSVLSATSFSISWLEPVLFSNTDFPSGLVFSGTFGTVVAPATVPVPAGAPLLLSALGLLVWRRKGAAAA